MTPVHIAVKRYNDSKIFQQVLLLLIEGGADLNKCPFTSNESPLFTAVSESKVEIATHLIKHGADASVEGLYDLTILQRSCQRNLVDFVDLLLGSGIIKWSAESWLDIGALDSGINRELLKTYDYDIPLTLHGKLDLYFAILEAKQTPLSLACCCRQTIRKELKTQLHLKVQKLGLPTKLQNYIMIESV